MAFLAPGTSILFFIKVSGKMSLVRGDNLRAVRSSKGFKVQLLRLLPWGLSFYVVF